MNRRCAYGVAGQRPVPHVRGDEPYGIQGGMLDAILFPTCVGMNRNH